MGNGTTYLVCVLSILNFRRSQNAVFDVCFATLDSPGRFFASVMLKTMIAHVLIHYDVKMKNTRTRPADLYIAGVCLPDPKAEVMFRKRCT